MTLVWHMGTTLLAGGGVAPRFAKYVLRVVRVVPHPTPPYPSDPVRIVMLLKRTFSFPALTMKPPRRRHAPPATPTATVSIPFLRPNCRAVLAAPML